MSTASVSVTRHPKRVVRTVLATILAAYGIFAAQAENPADRADRVDKEWPLIVTADHADDCGKRPIQYGEAGNTRKRDFRFPVSDKLSPKTINR